jgi:hypothetical protein
MSVLQFGVVIVHFILSTVHVVVPGSGDVAHSLTRLLFPPPILNQLDTSLMLFMPFSPFIPVAVGPDNNSPWVKTQGKVAELRVELAAGSRKDKNHSTKKIALKKIVANMTMSNNDMVSLFPDIIQCMSIPSLEIKKM